MVESWRKELAQEVSVGGGDLYGVGAGLSCAIISVNSSA